MAGRFAGKVAVVTGAGRGIGRETAFLFAREVFICGGHVALVQEPELIRAPFNPDGWSLDALCAPEVVAGLTCDQRNRYKG